MSKSQIKELARTRRLTQDIYSARRSRVSS